MIKKICVFLLVGMTIPVCAQRLLTLDSCRAMALRNNKQMGVAKVKQDIAENLRKSARTKYMPHISALGTYQYTSREISLLNDVQKATLPHLGDAVVGGLQTDLSKIASGLPMENISLVLSSMGLKLEDLQNLSNAEMQKLGGQLNGIGQSLVDALDTDTRHLFAGTVMVVQPVFLGGSIIALNKMADINEEMQETSAEARRQATLYNTDKVYWQVVSLKHKQRLAQGYLDLVQKLSSDVNKMIAEGVATRSDGLSVEVKVNEAEMTLQKVNDGLVLSKMLLCQTLGLPLDEAVTLADEDSENIAVVELTPELDVATAVENRPELKLLEDGVRLSKQVTNVLRAAHLPMVALTGGYSVTNPSLFNGFERKFKGFWNVGVIVRVPIWNWGDVMYKVRASKGATSIANLELQEAREKIELQVNQNTFRVNEANKKLTMAQSSIARADENLRTANLGFQEGVISPTTVMEAQTAWLQAQSQKIDAEIDFRLSQVDLQKSLGILE
ncbi:MAG: TolC family protein [Bacteroidaceae bacterium]|nr:TolC family protein [Bacteroidaceae bacterium]